MSELDRLYERMDRGFSELNMRLDAINGRVRENERTIAVLEAKSGSDPTARWTGGLAGLGVIVAEVAHRIFGTR